MESSRLEKISEQKLTDLVKVNDGQTGEAIWISEKLNEQIKNRDKSVANKEFPGIYVSPRFGTYRSYSNFVMFCED
jgi:hypothetical protein